MNKFFCLLIALFASSAAHAISYECEPESQNATYQSIELLGDHLVVSSFDHKYGMEFEADFDPAFEPLFGKMGRAQFKGKEYGHSRFVILDSELQAGARVGYLEIQGESFSYEYRCVLNLVSAR